jgi:hypothetical protein
MRVLPGWDPDDQQPIAEVELGGEPARDLRRDAVESQSSSRWRMEVR